MLLCKPPYRSSRGIQSTCSISPHLLETGDGNKFQYDDDMFSALCSDSRREDYITLEYGYIQLSMGMCSYIGLSALSKAHCLYE